MDHEENIQSQQTEKTAQIRIPRANEDSRRPQGYPSTTQTRPQGSRRLIPGDRLKKRVEFLRVMHRGHRLVGKLLCVDRREGPNLRFGVTTSKRYGNAPERNRFKRLVREAFRTSRTLLPQDIELNILPRQQAKGAMMEDIQKELLRLVMQPPHAVKPPLPQEAASLTHFGKPLFPDIP